MCSLGLLLSIATLCVGLMSMWPPVVHAIVGVLEILFYEGMTMVLLDLFLSSLVSDTLTAVTATSM